MQQHLTEYLIPLYRKKGRILLWALGTALLFYGFSYLLPAYYEAQTSVLPGLSSESELNFNSFGQMFPFLNLPPAENKADLYVQILRSRTVGERIITRFHLQKEWHEASLEKALKKLASHTSMVSTREGMILLSYESRSPEQAARIANAYIEELDRVNRETNTSRARSARLYIEEQLQKTEKELADASRDLADFQLQHKTIDLAEQLKAAIEQAAELKGKIIAKEVQLGILRQNMKTGNPRVQELETEIQQLRLQYDRLQFGGDRPLTERNEFFVAFSEAPEISLQLADLMRRVKIKETVFELLNQQYYQAKIEEAKNTPTIQVLDRAKIPERKSRPFRLLIALTGFLIGAMITVVRTIAGQYGAALKEQHPEEYHRWSQFKELIRSDWYRLIHKQR